MKTLKRLSKEKVLYIFKEMGRDINVKYYIDRAKQNWFIQFTDGYIVEFERSNISSTMSYNDEYEAPSKEYDSWVNYNMFYEFKHGYFDNWIEAETSVKERGCCSGSHCKMYLSEMYSDDRKIVSLKTRLSPYGNVCKAKEQNGFIRYLTDEEHTEMLEVYEELKQAYEKRLKTYYKRYANKITTHGYWANR